MPSIISATTTNGVAISPDNSGSLQLATNNGTTAVTIDTSQNVGIGTSSPVAGYRLTLQGSAAGMYLNATGGTARTYAIGTNINTGTGELSFYDITANTERMRITSGGEVLIGTTTALHKLTVVDTNPIAGTFKSDSASGAGIYLDNSGRASGKKFGIIVGNVANGAFSIKDETANADRLVITSGGELFYNCTGRTNDAPNAAGGRINETNGNEKVRVAADTQVAFQFYSPSGGTNSPVGTITANASSVSYNTSSDYRLKENVAPMTGALATVTQLKPVTYIWKNTGKAGQGFIAHELQAVVPDAVTGEKDAVETYTDEEGNEQTRPVYQGVDTSFLVATLTAAIQELKAELDATKAEVQALKGAA